MDKEIIDFALQIPIDLKIKKYNSKVWGKWVLRKAFEDVLPEEIIWQDKRPLEYGSGMVRLRGIISSKISDDEFEEKKKIYPINFLNKEHLYYYEIYRKEIGEIQNQMVHKGNAWMRCSNRGDAFHCKICGYVLDWRSK